MFREEAEMMARQLGPSATHSRADDVHSPGGLTPVKRSMDSKNHSHVSLGK